METISTLLAGLALASAMAQSPGRLSIGRALSTIKRIFIVLIFVFFPIRLFAATYYVKNGGNDGNTGLSDTQAWATIAKVNAHTFSPGDSILFKKGDSWRETLTLPSSGAADNYIVFSSYGTGENPRILGSTQAITWTEYSPNIWKSSTAFSSNPYLAYACEIFFENTDGTKAWGTYKTSTANLTAEYNWAWASSNIYVYSTSNPATKYASVEVPQRESAVNMNKKNHIRFDGINIFYTYWSGYGYDHTHYDMFEQFGLIIENSNIGYIGAWDASIEQGYGIEVVYTDMIVRNNLLHDCGRRSFGMDIYGSGYTARNILVEDNEFYNGFHTTGLDIDVGAGFTGNIDGVIVRRNKFYETSPTRSSDYSNLIFIQNNNPFSCSINNVYIYSNTFKWPNGYAILMENAQSVFIYNNVFCDKNINTGWAPFVAVQGSSRATVENNIFYRSSSSSSSEVEKNSTTTNNYNLYFNCTVSGLETNGIFSKNPLFVDPGNNNFHLQAGSPAIGAGIAIPEVTSDFEKNTFTNPPNIGCYGTPTLTTNPVFLGAAIENVTPSLLEIRFNQVLANIAPATSAFTVGVNAINRTVNSVAISGTKVQLTLASAVAYGDVVTAAYTKPLLNPIQSSLGITSDSFTAQPVMNNVLNPAIQPVYVSSVVENATPASLVMTYNTNLANSVPAASAFTVLVNSVARAVNAVSIAGTQVQLALASPVAYGDVITVSYTKPATNPLQTGSGGQAASLSAQPVTNHLRAGGPGTILDLADFAWAYGSSAAAGVSNWLPYCDLNGDGIVDDADINLFLAAAGF